MAKTFAYDKYDGLDGKTKISLVTINEPQTFSSISDPQGLTLKGEIVIKSEKELQEFARLISDMWSEHRKLAPKILRTTTGH